MVQTFRRRDLVSRGEWLATILERFDKDKDGATRFLQAIAEVWKEEDYCLPDGVDRDRPDPGLLKSIGYHVGWHHGQAPATRMSVIGFLLIAPQLPRIKDRRYMEEWGEPQSLKRYQKFTSVLCNLIVKKSVELTIQRWGEQFKNGRLTWNSRAYVGRN